MTEQQAGPLPVCPRHPDRVSYVSCQRCGRPTCPACQRPAAVGIQCVDCVKEGARSMPKARTVFGGSAGNGKPYVTYTLIGLCVLIWIGQLASPQVTQWLEFAPIQGYHQPWRMLTVAFVHAPSLTDVYHIGFNMYALWVVGQYLEPLLGRARFLTLYLISGVGGSVGYELMTSPPVPPYDQPSGWTTATVGASGAIFGLFAALLIMNRHLNRSTGGIIALIVINLFIGFVVPGIAWQAHVGGAIVGAICALAFTLTAEKARRALQWPALGVILVVIVALAYARYAAAGLPYPS